MKKCKLYKTRRLALGLSQKELADLAGVSASVVSRFELGEELSVPYMTSICRAIDYKWSTLDRTEEMETRLRAQLLQLEEEETIMDKLITLGYMHKTLSNYQVELLKTVRYSEEERP